MSSLIRIIGPGRKLVFPNGDAVEFLYVKMPIVVRIKSRGGKVSLVKTGCSDENKDRESG